MAEIEQSSSAEVRRCLAVLGDRGMSVASCESLTGGLVGAAITAVPGASAVYRGGLITYATELKAELAGVDRATLQSDGAVSARTVFQMALGAARVCGADWGLATTGVAGPDAQEGHPPGTVFVAVARPALDRVSDEGPVVARQVTRLALVGDRDEIRRQCVTALFGLFEACLAGPDRPRSPGSVTVTRCR